MVLGVITTALLSSTVAAGPNLSREALLKSLRNPSELTISVQPADLDAVPRGAFRVSLLPLKMKASCEGDITVKFLRVKLVGMGDASDIRRVYLLEGMGRLTPPKEFSTDDRTALFTLRNFVVPSCGTRDIDVAVDFERTAASGGKFALSIESKTDIGTTADRVSTSFPVRTRQVVSSITPELFGGTVTITFLPLPGAVSAVRDEVMAKFHMEADGERDQMIHWMTLTNKGSAKNDELRNLYITRNSGSSLTPIVKQLDGSKALFRFFRPYFLKKGQKIQMELRGNAYTTRQTIQFTLEEPSDLYSVPTRSRAMNER